MDELDEILYVCMLCQRTFNVTQGTWPQVNSEQELVLDADFNDRSLTEFCCYDCAG